MATVVQDEFDGVACDSVSGVMSIPPSSSLSERDFSSPSDDGSVTPSIDQVQLAREVADVNSLSEMRRKRRAELALLRSSESRSMEIEREKSKKDRLTFLLKQTEIYSHFVSRDSPKKAPIAKKVEFGTRRRDIDRSATEEDEDAALLGAGMEDAEGTRGNDTLHTTVQTAAVFLSNGTPRSYQIEGINWLLQLYGNGLNGILADEMGLGKTMQTLGLLGYLDKYRGVSGPNLVIAPKSTVGTWKAEAQRWVPQLRMVVFQGDKVERQDFIRAELSVFPYDFNILVTSYEIAMREKLILRKISWRYLIVDEAHRIKNERSVLSQVVRLFETQYRLLLTGTPLQNNLRELWALLNFLMPDVFDDAQSFEDWFTLDRGDAAEGQVEIVQQLHKVLRPFLLRRLKSEVERSIPPKKEMMLYVGLSEMQRRLYRQILERDLDAINAPAGGQARLRLLNVLMQLRKCVNHPYLFEGQEPGPPFDNELMITSSGKLALLDRLLPHFKEKGHRVLIFSQMTRLLDILEDYCVHRGFHFLRIDGSTPSLERQESIDAYNAPNSPYFVFLLSTRAGGLGINLATADTVIMYDSDWNPQSDLQAMDRCHRIGQVRPVTVFRLSTQGSVEEKIVERAARKLFLDQLVIQQGRLAEQNPALRKEELLEMIRFGAEQLLGGNKSDTSEKMVSSNSIEEIIEEGSKLSERMLSTFKDRAAAFSLKLDGNFDRMDVGVVRKGERSFSPIFLEPGPRDKKVVGYNAESYYRDILKSGAPKRSHIPRPPKESVADFQFYPARLRSLLKKREKRWHAVYDPIISELPSESEAATPEDSKVGSRVPSGANSPKPDSDDVDASVKPKSQEVSRSRLIAEKARKRAVELGLQVDDTGRPELLSTSEAMEKDDLIARGFPEWSRRDVRAYVYGCELYGRNDLRRITKEVGTKSEREVSKYADVFWKRGPSELSDWDRIRGAIERGESRRLRKGDIDILLKEWLDKQERGGGDALFCAKVPNQAGASHRLYAVDEDRLLLVATARLGYGNWEELKIAVRDARAPRLDWFLRTRTPQELGRRVETLVRCIEREMQSSGEKDARKSCVDAFSPGSAEWGNGASGVGGKSRDDSSLDVARIAKGKAVTKRKNTAPQSERKRKAK